MKMKVKLDHYIDVNYQSNVSAFSKASGLIRQKTQRLIDMDCDIDMVTGKITRTEIKHVCKWGVK